ncbi:MAG: M4 family metallopeptidase [Chloroflexi bacterium]|nr:M4 family metallopeptidase [Chloroflexota bacterium]
MLCVLFGSLLVIGGVSAGQAHPLLQDGGPVQTVTHDQTGYYTFVGVDTAARGSALPGAMAFQGGTPTAATALADISAYAREFGLENPAQELQFKQTFGTPGGSTTFRYQQVYQGIPVIAGEMLANYDPRGRLSALAGETSPKLALPTTPTVTADAALALALETVAKDSGAPAAELTGSTPALWIYDPRLLQPSDFPARLVWRTEVTPAQGHQPIRYLVLVDAQFPTVALAFNQVDTFWGKHAVAHAASGVDRPKLSTANMPLPSPNYLYPPGATYNSNFTSYRRGAGSSTLVCNTVPTALSGAGSCSPSGAVPAANMAQYFAYATFNYYDYHHNRNSINNAGMPLYSNVNYRDPYDPFTPYMNAFWDGIQMTYGDGDIFTVDDVVAHELSHGVTENSSNLFYFYESGAINESMSDVFGEFADQWNGIDSFGGADLEAEKWVMGEDMNADPIRNMADPTIYFDPDSTQSPYYYPYASDNGGVHYNSGVSNKAAYLMAAGGTFGGYTITALGNDKTSAIYYEANTQLLTSGADYQMLGAALVQACNNIRAGANPLGITADECVEVDEAIHAVGMHLDPVAGVEFRPKADLCPRPMEGNQPSYLFKDDFEQGTGNFVPGTIINPVGMPASLAFQRTTVAFQSSYATSGTESLFGVNHPYLYGGGSGYAYEGYVQMKNAVTLPVASTYYLYFNHAVALETSSAGSYAGWDGAIVEYSVNGGAWIDASSLFDDGKNYDGVLHPANPLPDERSGFTKHSHGYVSSRYNLSSLAGKSVRFRWIIAADSYGSYWGWFLDDVQIYQCPSGAVGTAGQEGMNVPSGGTYNLGMTYLGQPTTRTITVSNTGVLDLLLLSAAPTVSTGFTATNFGQTILAPGESTTFDLTCQAAAAGTPVTGTVSIASDGIVNPFTFKAACTVMVSGTTAYPTRNYFTLPNVPLSWNRIPWATGYEVQVSQSPAFTGAPIFAVDPPGALTMTTPPLTVDGLYYWRVRAIRANGTPGAWSAADTFFLNLP